MDNRDQQSLPIFSSNPPQQYTQIHRTTSADGMSRSPSPTTRRPTTGSSTHKEYMYGSEENLSRTLSHREQKDPPFSRSGPPGQAGSALRRPPIATMGPMSPARRSVIDWVVPAVEEKPAYPMQEPSIFDRLHPTVVFAEKERDKYAAKAKFTGLALNIAIGLQVLIGALITGLSAVTSGKQTSIMTSILGGLSTIVASYLARARGSNEPELSIARVKDLDQFVRECEAFELDHGQGTGHEHDGKINDFRRRFEELLGNANGERKLSPPA